MAQRLLLRRRPLNSPLPLPLPLIPHLHTQSVDPLRDGVPTLQSHLFLVRPRQLLHCLRDSVGIDGGQIVQPERDRDGQRDIELFLSGVVDDVFYFEFGESAAGEQVGVYGCDDWVFDCDDLYDGAFFFFRGC